MFSVNFVVKDKCDFEISEMPIKKCFSFTGRFIGGESMCCDARDHWSLYGANRMKKSSVKTFAKILIFVICYISALGYFIHANANKILIFAVENVNERLAWLALVFNADCNLMFLDDENRSHINYKVAENLYLLLLFGRFGANDLPRYSLLQKALKNNDYVTVKLMLDNLDYSSYSNYSFLNEEIFAVKDPEILKLLIKNNFDLSEVFVKKIFYNEYDSIKPFFDFEKHVDSTLENGINPLMGAIINRNHELFELLINHKANVNTSYNDGDTPLFMALRNGADFKMVRTLVENSSEINVMNKFGEYPLEVLTDRPGNEEIIKYLIEKGAGVESRTCALIRSVFTGRKEYIDLIQKSGVRIDPFNTQRKVVADDYRLMELLIKNGVDIPEYNKKNLDHNDIENIMIPIRGYKNINQRDAKGQTPLSYAVERNLFKSVKLLIESGADINAKDSDEVNLIFKAIDHENSYMIKLLLDSGIDVNARNGYGETPLISHIKRNPDDKVVRCIMECGADANLTDASGHDAFYYLNNWPGYWEHKDRLLDILKKYKVPKSREIFRKREAAGYNMLTREELDFRVQDAIENNNCESFEIFFSPVFGSDFYSFSISRVINEAIIENNLKLMHLIIEKMNYFDEKLVLSAIIKNSGEDVIKYLIDKTTTLNAKPLAIATYKKDRKLMKYIIDTIKKRSNGNGINLSTPLNVAVDLNDYESAKLLLDSMSCEYIDEGGSVTGSFIACFQSDEYKENPLNKAIKKGYENIAKLLIDKGADINRKNALGFTPLIYSVWFGRTGIVDYLLQKGADPNQSIADGTNALMFAAMSGNTESIKLLLGKGAKINAKNNNGINALCEAITSNRANTIELLKNNGASYTEAVEIINEIKSRGTNINSGDRSNNNMIMKAAYCKNFLMAKLLIDRGADINDVTRKSSILSLVLSTGDSYYGYNQMCELFKLFLDKGADPYFRNDKEIFVDLIGKMISSGTESMNDILENKPDSLNIRTETKLIGTAIDLGYIFFLKQLVKNGIDVNGTIKIDNKYDEPVFFKAVENGCHEILEFLIESGADLKSKSRFTNDNRNKEIIDIIRNCGGNALSFISEDRYFSLLERETAEGWGLKILDILLKRGCDINQRNDYGYTPLAAMAYNSDVKLIMAMIKKGAIVNVSGTDELKLSVLSIAAIHNRPRVIKSLIENGAEINYKAKNDRTPLMLAVENGNVEVADTLIKYGADINAVDSDGMTALDITYFVNFRNAEERDKLFKLLKRSGARSNKKKYEAKWY